MDKVNKNRLSDSGALDKDSKELRNVTEDEVSRFNGVFSKKQKQPDKDEKFNSKNDDCDDDKSSLRLDFSGDDASAAQSNIQSAAGANPGDAILSNLNKYSEFYRTDGIRGAQTQAAKVVQLVGNEIVERMLASSAALDAKQEVRIFLKNDILAQTEVRIAKENTTGVLNVEFHTHSDESAKFLSVNQSGLQQHLMNNLRDVSAVDIKVFHESAGNGQNNIVVEVQGKPASVEHGDAKVGGHHKSTGNEKNDGRSRQEYVGDLDEDEKKKDKK